MFLVNFKTYQEVTGEKSVSMAKAIQEVAKNYEVETIICPEAVDARDIMREVELPVWAQHVDVYSAGQSTGWFPPEVAKAEGFSGTLLNHSEHKLEKHMLEEIVHQCKKEGLKVLIFAASQEEAMEVAKFEPDYVSYEPPELIGSQKSSVAESRPETIRKVVESLPNIPILVGAGIKSTQDVKVSLQMGAKGVLVSSAIVLAEDPKQKTQELLDGFK
jgi:triosephosphate isomerase (TIM)